MSKELDTKDESISLENHISLKQFPPKLRKLAKYILKNGLDDTVKQTCENLSLNYPSILTMIYKEKKKGNDFNSFLENVSESYLDSSLLTVDHSTIEQAVSGSHADRKLYYQRVGKLNDETVQQGITLAIGINLSSERPSDMDRDKGVIDTEPVIPKGS